MKRILLTFCFCLVIFSLVGEERKKIDLINEDVEYFYEIIKNGYIDYDNLNKNKKIVFDKKKCVNTYKKEEKKRAKRGLNDPIVNGINQEALIVPLWSYLNELEPEDCHLSLKTNVNRWYLTKRSWFYYSSYLFEKKNNEFYLYPDLNRKYTGLGSDLKRIIDDSTEKYIYAPVVYYPKDGDMINIDGKEEKVELKEPASKTKKENVFSILTTEDSMIINASDFNFAKNSKEYELFESVINEIQGLREKKANIVLDLRGNSGGYLYFTDRLLMSLFIDLENENQVNDFFKYLDFVDRGKIELSSYVIAKQKLERAIKEERTETQINDSYEIYENEKQTKVKKYSGLDTVTLTEIPQYKEWSTVTEYTNIIVLVDNFTASAAEKLIGYLYMVDKEKVILVGENTNGVLNFGGVLNYELPNSHIEVSIPSVSNKKTAMLSLIDNWKGEGYGFFPDYWIFDGKPGVVLTALTNDINLSFF